MISSCNVVPLNAPNVEVEKVPVRKLFILPFLRNTRNVGLSVMASPRNRCEKK